MSELKPCPFCGELPEKIFMTEWYAACKNYGCPNYLILKLEAWNTRQLEDELSRKILQLEIQNENLRKLADKYSEIENG